MSRQRITWQRQPNPAVLDVPVIGRIEGCTHPESADMLPDGEHVVFGNCAMSLGIESYRQGKALVYLEGEAFISLARLSASGVELIERRHITGQTGTLGLDILRTGTAQFPVGTVFQAAGGNPIVRTGETRIADEPERLRAQALAYDPIAGKVLGCIPLWHGSAIAERFNAFDQPNGLAINNAGDLFVGDIPNGNPVDVLPPPVPSAVYRIPHHALDALSRGEPGSADQVQRIHTPGFVNGVTVSPVDGLCWIVSCSSHDAAQGALYRLTDADWESGVLPEPAISGLGVLDGVTFTRRGTAFVTNPRTGEVIALLPDGDHRILLGDGLPIARFPADINVCYPARTNGEPVLIVPDVTVTGAEGEGTITFLDISGL